MLIYFKKSMMPEASEVDSILSDMKRLQDLSEVAFLEYSGAQRQLQSRSERILELSNRLRNGAHPVRERSRLEDDLVRLQNTASLEAAVEAKRLAYEDAKKKLKAITDKFNASYLTVDLPEAKAR